jgi:hypothetical protein
MRILLDEPTANVPIVQETDPLELVHPGETETKVTPPGKESVNVMPEADDGPALETVKV